MVVIAAWVCISGCSSTERPSVHAQGLTENQGRLLYLISLYTKPARTASDREEWIRKQALMVLVYEAIVKKALDFDYAPSSELVEGRRVYFNTSQARGAHAPPPPAPAHGERAAIAHVGVCDTCTQEGRSDIDLLREEGLLNGLKVSSKTYQPITCYQARARACANVGRGRRCAGWPQNNKGGVQISDKGLDLVRRLPKADREAIHGVVYKDINVRSLLHPIWDAERCQYFMLPEGETDTSDAEPSTVMRCESVSYVSSAYVPQCLRFGGRPTMSNAHRANESAVGASSLRDELDEVCVKQCCCACGLR